MILTILIGTAGFKLIALMVSALAIGLAFEPQDLRDIRNLGVAANKQNTYLTPIAAANMTAGYRPRNAGNYTASHPADFYTDKSMANKGHQFATVNIRTSEKDTTFDGAIDLDAFMAGYLLFFILGTESVVGSNPYTHTMKFLQATNQMPVTTLLLQETNDVIYQFPDMSILDLVISGNNTGPLQAQFKMIGSGKKVSGAVPFPPLSAPLFLYGSDTDIRIGPAAPNLNNPLQQFVLSTVVAGALAQHTAFYKFVYRNAAGGTLASQEISILVPANSVAKATAPAAFPPGVTSVDVYAANTTGTETLQATGIAAAGGNLQEPNTGFIAGTALPTVTTALSSIKERVKDWQLHITAQIVINRAPGGGMWGTFTKVLVQGVALTVNVKATSTDDMLTIADNDVEKEIQFNTNSGAAQQLNLQVPCASLKCAQVGMDGNEMMWQMSADESQTLKIGSQEVFQAVVINNQAAYGVGA